MSELTVEDVERVRCRAEDVLRQFDEDAECVVRGHTYECFRYQPAEVCLIFYPHQTSARNVHVRVRSQHSKNHRLAAQMLDALITSTGTCTFSVNNVSSCWSRRERLTALEQKA